MSELEQNMIKGIKSGDNSVFDLLFRTYYSLLFHLVKDIIGNRAIAEEITQDVFIKIWEMRLNLTIHDSLKAYLKTTAKNQAFGYLRSQKALKQIKTISYEDAEIQMKLMNMESNMKIQEELFTDPKEVKLKEVVENLAPQCKQIFVLSRYEEYTHQQIAEMLHITTGTVKKQIARALQKLKDVIQVH